MEKDSKNDLIQALRAGAQGTARSNAARLREIVDEIEDAKKSGLSNKQIVAILESRGLCFSSVGSFEITYHRIQKNRGKTGKAKKPLSEHGEADLEVKPAVTAESVTAVAKPVTPEAALFIPTLAIPQTDASENNGFEDVVRQIKEAEAHKDPRRKS